MDLGSEGTGDLRSRALSETVARFKRITSVDGLEGDAIFHALIDEAVAAIAAVAGGIYLFDEAEANLELRLSRHFPEHIADRYRLIPLSADVPLVDAAKTLVPVFLGSIDDYVARYPDYASLHPTIASKAFVALPLVSKGRCLGAIALGFDGPRPFTPDERANLGDLADQCAQALDRASRHEFDQESRRLAQRPPRRLERLHAFTGALAQASTPEQVIETVVERGIAAASALGGDLWLLSPDGAGVVLSRRVGLGGAVSRPPVPILLDGSSSGPLVDALRDGVAIWIESRSQLQERYPSGSVEFTPAGEGSLACLPLFAQGRCIGGLAYTFEGIHRFHEDERAFLQVISWHSAQALERARLYAAEKSARERAEVNQRRSDFIADMGMLLASSLDYSSILADVARGAVPRFADWCVLELVDQRLHGTPPAANHADPWKVPLALEIRRRISALGDFGFGITAVMRSGVAQLHASIPAGVVEKHFAADRMLLDLMRQVGVGSALVVPMAARGKVLGVILLVRVAGAPAYDAQDLAAVEELGRSIGLAVDNARLYKEAREADRSKDEFLAMLGHELRNPLAPIMLALDLMEANGEQVFADERAIISRQVRHLLGMVEDLLDVARIVRGKLSLHLQRCELAPIIAAAVELASPLVEQRSHRLVVSVPERGMTVMAEPPRLAQAIANLLNNAAKFTDPGGAIAIGAAWDGGDTVVRVRDSGLGIAPDLIPRIFDPFVQAAGAPDRSRGGLGIGLAVVQSVVGLHGGTVSAHSAGLGQGSEFIVRLPRAEADAAVTSGGSSGDAQVSTVGGCRVLAVDDNRDAAAMLGKALEAFGCSVRVVSDGAAAFAAVADFQPQLVLLDIGLPGIDGYELARRLRQSHLDPSVKIVAVTGYGQPSDRARSQEAGFDDHIVKPMSLQTLQRILEGCAATRSPVSARSAPIR